MDASPKLTFANFSTALATRWHIHILCPPPTLCLWLFLAISLYAGCSSSAHPVDVGASILSKVLSLGNHPMSGLQSSSVPWWLPVFMSILSLFLSPTYQLPLDIPAWVSPTFQLTCLGNEFICCFPTCRPTPAFLISADGTVTHLVAQTRHRDLIFILPASLLSSSGYQVLQMDPQSNWIWSISITILNYCCHPSPP